MKALRVGPWKTLYPPSTKQRVSLYETQGCGIVSEYDDGWTTPRPSICAHPRWTSPDTLVTLPCCEEHIHAWISLVGVAGAMKHRVFDPQINKHVPALLLPTRIEERSGNGRVVCYQHTAQGSATSCIELTHEEAQVAADEIESLGAHDGINLVGHAWLSARLRVLAAELDSTRSVIATCTLVSATFSDYRVKLSVYRSCGAWHARGVEEQTDDYRSRAMPASPHNLMLMAKRVELEDGKVLSCSGFFGSSLV